MPSELIQWQLAWNEQVMLYGFDTETGILQRNGEISQLEPEAAALFEVLLRHPDAPVTVDDFLESGLPIRKGMIDKTAKRLAKDPLIGKHIQKAGDNRQALHAFVTNPEDISLLLDRVKDMHISEFGSLATQEALKSRKKLLKIEAIAASVAAVATGIVILKNVHRKPKNN